MFELEDLQESVLKCNINWAGDHNLKSLWAVKESEELQLAGKLASVWFLCLYIYPSVFCHMKCTPDMWSRRQEQIQSFFKTLNSKQKRFSVGMFFHLMWMVWDGVFRWLNPLCSLSLTLSFSRMFRIRSWWVTPCRVQPWKTPKFPVERSAICKATTHNTLKQWHICLKTHFFSHVGPNLIICFLWIETLFLR